MDAATANDGFVGNAERTSLPRLVMGIARSVRDAPVPNSHQTAVCDVWRQALGASDEADLLEGLALFARSLRRVDGQIETMPLVSTETKNYVREAVSGLLNSVAPNVLPGAFSSVAPSYAEDKLLRLAIAGDLLVAVAPEAVPSEDAVTAMTGKLDELQAILDEAELPRAIKAELERRLNGVRRALKRARRFGGGELMDATGQLAGITVAARAAAREGAVSAEGQSALKKFGKGVIVLLDWAGRASLIWDMANAGSSALGGVEGLRLLGGM